MLFDSGSGKATNNTAEYEGLLAGLRAAAGLGVKNLVVRGDSQLVVRQVTKEYGSPQMGAYLDEVRKLEQRFDCIQMEHIPRGENLVADELSKMAAERKPVPPGVFVERLVRPSIEPKLVPGTPSPPTQGAPGTMPAPRASGPRGATSPPPGTLTSRGATSPEPGASHVPGEHDVMATERATPPWAMDLLRYIRDRVLPEDDAEAERIARQAKMYVLVDGDIYRRRECGLSFSASQKKKGERCCWISMKVRALVTSLLELWQEKLSDKVSTGPPRWRMRNGW